MTDFKTILAMAVLVAALAPQAANAQGTTCDKDVLKPRRETFLLPPYPDEAKANREQGTTVLRLVVGKSGQAISAKVESSSGSVPLDQRAVEWVTEIFRWDVVKPECRTAETQVRIVWTLSNADTREDAETRASVDARTEQALLDLFTRAQKAEDSGQLDTALDLYDKAIAILPTAITALHNRGIIYERKKDYVHALADYDKAIQIAPDISHLYVRRCSYYIDRKDFDHALADCDKAIALDPANALAYHTRGRAYALRQDAVHALPDFSEAIRLKPDAAFSYYERSRIYGFQDKADLAFADIQIAIRLKSDYGNFYFARGAIQGIRKNYDEAISDISKALELGVTSDIKIPAYVSRANAYERKRDYARAIADFDSAIALEPTAPAALNGRCWARAMANTGLEKALDDCNMALKSGPKNVAIIDSRGFVHFRRGELDKAIADYDAALALAPNTVSTLYKRGIAKSQKGDTAGGKADMDAALALDKTAGDLMRDAGVRP